MPSQNNEWSQIPVQLWGEMKSNEGKRISVHPASDVTFVNHNDSHLAPRLFVWGAGGDSGYTFQNMRQGIAYRLAQQPTIHRGNWQTLDVSESDAHSTYELRNVNLFYTVPKTYGELVADVKPDLPWADDHFLERVSGEPSNPSPSYVNWPHHTGQADRHVQDKVFSHTYPERFWPKFANVGNKRPNGRQVYVPHNGIRFEYGDLNGVVEQLVKNPMTRQAVLPVWFPEDTGATDRRVPCSLTYHFMADDEYRLSMWYSMRACDFVRHFHNDVYFASLLLSWMCKEVTNRTAGNHLPSYAPMSLGEVNMNISSLHAFKGDFHKMGYSA